MWTAACGWEELNLCGPVSLGPEGELALPPLLAAGLRAQRLRI